MNRHLMGTAVAMVLMQSVQEGNDTSGSKAPKFCDKEYDLDTGTATFQFGNGTILEKNVNELPDEIRTKLMYHGFMQKVGDSFAGAKGDYTKGVDSARSVIEQLEAGEWRSARGEGESKPRLSELAAAIARVKGIEEDQALAAVTKAAALDGSEEEKKQGQEKLKAWRAHPRIKAALATIKAEKAQAELAAAGDTADVSLD